MDYKDMKVAELKSLCAERGIAVPSKATKAQMVGWLEAADLNSPIEVEAVPVEDEIIPAKALSVDVEAMQAAAIGLTAAMDDAATALGEFDVEDGTLEAMAVGDVKVCEAGIASALNDVDARRKELTRLLTEPKKAIDAKVKELTGPLSELAQRYADRRQAVYMEGYEAQYQECCIANGLEAMVQAVPFDRFIARHGQWTSRTANPVKTQEKIAEEVARIARDWEALRGLKGSMRFYDDAEACFFETFDLNAAINRNKERTAQQQRIDAMNAEREDNERWQREAAERNARAWESAQEPPQTPVFEEVAPEPVPMQEPPAEPARAPQRKRYTFTVLLSDSEFEAFKSWKTGWNGGVGIGGDWTCKAIDALAIIKAQNERIAELEAALNKKEVA